MTAYDRGIFSQAPSPPRDRGWPRVRFHVRYPAGDGYHRYDPVDIAHPSGSGFIPLEYPPAPGDLITLWDSNRARRGLPQPEGGPVFRVLERLWSHASFGSVTFPYGEREPLEGPLTDIIVEPAASPWADEAPICAETTCEAKYLSGAWVLPPGVSEDEADPHEHAPYERKD